MTITPAQLDNHLKSLKGKSNLWPGIPGAQCMVIFASVNRLLGGPAYAAPGAKDLWNNPSLAAGYTQLPANATPRFGDIALWDGSWGAGWGHIAVVVEDLGNGKLWAFGQNPGPAVTATMGKNGLLGYLHPKNLASTDAAAGGAATRKVTQSVAWVRTAPRSDAPLAPGYPQGLAQGSTLVVKGYVAGQDPFPNDGVTDDAWYVTKSGFYVWANAAENSLAGLAKL